VLLLYPISVTVSFLANRAWSFGGRPFAKAQFARYVLVYCLTWPLSVALTWGQERLGVPAWFAALGTMAILVVGLFLLLNYWVFRAQPGAAQVSQ